MIMTRLFPLLRAGLFAFDAETAHGLTIRMLKAGLGPRVRRADPALSQDLFGLSFPNPLGLAAGFDKNAEVPDAMLGLGLGFTECGTVTPRPQAGNPRPRMFRLESDRAVINRLGFNNEGLEAAAARLEARRDRAGIVGANIGANKDTADKAADYVACLERLYPLADYFTVNVSSPNTPGLRDLQARDALDDLIARLIEARVGLAGSASPKPLLLKVAPDLGPGQAEDIVSVALARGVDGLIVSNTTIARPAGLQSEARDEAGGLSGVPLFEPSTDVLRTFYRLTGGHLPLVGVGGVSSADQAYAKIRAGASLVQLYTGLVYGGPGLIPGILDGLAARLAADGFARIAEAVGADHEASMERARAG